MALVATMAVAVIGVGLPLSLVEASAPDKHDAPARAAIPAGALHPCAFDRSVRCGAIHVPRDRRARHSGRMRIAYELYPRRDRSKPLLGTIVAVEGGPGYSTTDSRGSYLDLFGPLLDRRQLLLVDNRGTGKSDVISCPLLQSYPPNFVRAVGVCGRQLGSASDLYGSAIAAKDMVAVLNHLDIGRIDLYGDSYGTFFSQTFAVRHPARVRTVILDAAYFVGGTDPYYVDTNLAYRDAFRQACRRSPACAHRPGGTMRRISRLAGLLRHHPITGSAPGGHGKVRRTTVTIDDLVTLLTGAATSSDIYRELDAAARAVLRPHPYNRPLVRLVRETRYVGGAGYLKVYSEGLDQAVACNDYPQPYDMTSPVGTRGHQYHQALARLRATRPHVFAPFTVHEWAYAAVGYYSDCLRWPVPSRWVHPVPPRATYPNVPTLVLVGDLDSLTSPYGARATAQAFPNSTFVKVANTTHVSALVDFDQCASLLVRRFVQRRDAGDTSCAADYHENRTVDRFARYASQLGWKDPQRRAARVAASTVADIMARWWILSGDHGVGLQGGRFTTRGGYYSGTPPVVTWRLHGVRWVRDVAVSGRMRWNQQSGGFVAHVRVAGSGAPGGRLTLRWNDQDRHAQAVVHGRLEHTPVRMTFPAP